MAISDALGSCKAASTSRCYSYNRNNRPQSPLTLGSAHASLLPLAALLLLMLTSCLALPSESTTIVPIEELTTQQPAIEVTNSPQAQTLTTTVAAVVNNSSNVEIEPLKTAAAEIADEFVDTSFVSLGGEGLEQGIRNEVKSMVEMDSEADASGLLVNNEPRIINNNDEQTDEAQGVREPKTLDAEAAIEEKDVKETHDKLSPEAEEENTETETETELKEESDKPKDVAESQPETVTEQSITDSVNEQEEELDEKTENPPLPPVTSDLVAIIFDENRAITEQPITNTNRLALEHEHETVHLAEELPKTALEVTKHLVTKKQGVEDLLPVEVSQENADKKEEPQPEPVSIKEQEILEADQPKKETETTESLVPANEIEENIIESDANDRKEEQQVVEPEHVASTVASEGVAAAVKEVVVEAKEPVIAASSETPVESVTPTEETEKEVEAEETEVETESKPVQEESVGVKEDDLSSTAAPAETEVEKLNDESESNSEESEQQTKQPETESVEKDSSEESDEVLGDEPKAKAEDSTATPLVSYPPHNAGQTFDSNLADERSAYLSLASSGRSTLIIALCSGTAVIFIVISLVIFVLSFQRQHGTLDIEMQEQRLGKDNLDEEDAQLKLLDVDLSTPVIIAMGNEETDECL
ncbi:hypothetical protein ACLKA6_012191 [Drosophila palustris]